MVRSKAVRLLSTLNAWLLSLHCTSGRFLQLLAGAQIDHTLATASALVPVKAMDVGPWVIHDGAGRHSCGDWSTPLCSDKLKSLRTHLLGKVCDVQGPKRLLAKATWPNLEPLFSESEVQDARKEFFSCLGPRSGN